MSGWNEPRTMADDADYMYDRLRDSRLERTVERPWEHTAQAYELDLVHAYQVQHRYENANVRLA